MVQNYFKVLQIALNLVSKCYETAKWTLKVFEMVSSHFKIVLKLDKMVAKGFYLFPKVNLRFFTVLSFRFGNDEYFARICCLNFSHRNVSSKMKIPWKCQSSNFEFFLSFEIFWLILVLFQILRIEIMTNFCVFILMDLFLYLSSMYTGKNNGTHATFHSWIYLFDLDLPKKRRDVVFFWRIFDLFLYLINGL